MRIKVVWTKVPVLHTSLYWRVLAEAVRLHTEDRVLVYQNKTIVF